MLANACSAHSFTKALQGKGVSLQYTCQSLLLMKRKHWPRWARVGWPKEANVSNLLLLEAAETGRSAQRCSAEGRLCSPALGIAIAFFGLLLHAVSQPDKVGAKEESGRVRGYRTNQRRRWEETHSSVGVYWFFNCWTHLAAERVPELKWDTRTNNSQQTSKKRNFWLCILPPL